jgi:hypothetical protein
MSQQSQRVTTSQCNSKQNIALYTQACKAKGHTGEKLTQCVNRIGNYCNDSVHIHSDADAMTELFQCYQGAVSKNSGERAQHLQQCERQARK